MFQTGLAFLALKHLFLNALLIYFAQLLPKIQLIPILRFYPPCYRPNYIAPKILSSSCHKGKWLRFHQLLPLGIDPVPQNKCDVIVCWLLTWGVSCEIFTEKKEKKENKLFLYFSCTCWGVGGVGEWFWLGLQCFTPAEFRTCHQSKPPVPWSAAVRVQTTAPYYAKPRLCCCCC